MSVARTLLSVLLLLSTAGRASATWCGYANNVHNTGKSTDATVRNPATGHRGLAIANGQVDARLVCIKPHGNCVARRGRLVGTVTPTGSGTANLDGTLTYSRGGLVCDFTCFLTDEPGHPNSRGSCSYSCPSGPVTLGSFGFSRNCFQ